MERQQAEVKQRQDEALALLDEARHALRKLLPERLLHAARCGSADAIMVGPGLGGGGGLDPTTCTQHAVGRQAPSW